MKREEQLFYCKKCILRKNDINKGIICEITNEKADFKEECPTFQKDINVKDIPLDNDTELSDNEKKKIINIFWYVGIIVFFLFMYRRCNEWNNRLSSEEGKITVAHVYNSSQGRSISYEYIYKVGVNYYTTATSGSNVNSLKNNPIQCFLVAYDQSDPTIHTVIWSYKYKNIIPLGESIIEIPNKNELIKKHTVGWNGLSPRADKNNWKEINEYKRK